jgi:biotin transport system substrate-specific component
MLNGRSRTLAHHLGATSAARDAVAIVAASLFLALLSQAEIRLPWTPVPVTLQTLGVFVIGAALGARRGAAAVAAYVIQGAAGLPFFSGGASGPAHLVGPTGGYLVGFVGASFVIGLLAEHGWDRSLVRTFAAMSLGAAVIFACGLAQLSFFVPRSELLALGLIPFLPGAALKVALAAVLLPTLWGFLQRHGVRSPH